ncbi:hypothetical protein CQ018_06305 [Arthrobacter sp. MYb227]|uniref:tyrosine-protein phosphatase n=1 Tax=Arthrobacter sp. MYb227 TaxID=1848601 RepID=UPI000CFC9CB5|nr:tyrosine-protein phosphatase [Arthrobacter sp. MYb227]PQZ94948.1 hypothetical protein CQ018_06305 [Arthrobacter sp. MYb227]
MNSPVYLEEATRTPLANLRDLSGVPLARGSIIPGMLWRSDDISLSPETQVRSLAQAGLSTIIDLRSADELKKSVSPFLSALGIEHRHVPVLSDVSDPESLGDSLANIDSAQAVGTWYAQTFSNRAGTFVTALDIIANSTGATLFHCAAGKDRTGMLAAAIFTVLGASRDDIVADYAHTDTNIAAVMGRLAVAAKASENENNHQVFEPDHPLLRAQAPTMESMIDALEPAGGIREILREAGLGQELEVRLRNKLVVGG